MSIESYLEYSPEVSDSAFIASSADVIGKVSVGEKSSLWYNVTARGDVNSIRIGDQTNVQDNAVLHNSDDFPCILGNLVTVGHSAVIHACEIGDEVLVGMGAVVLDGAVIGEQSIIGAKSLVTGGTVIPPGSLVLGSPAKVVRELSAEERSKVKDWAVKYVKISRNYLERDRKAKEGQG